MTSVGERIKARRSELGWTQDDLARRAGISKSFLSDLENDRRSVSAANLLEIAKVLGYSMDYLMTGASSDRAAELVTGKAPPQDVSIPAALSAIAKEEGLSFSQTEHLLSMRDQIVAHRSTTKSRSNDDFDWRQFYKAVRQWL